MNRRTTRILAGTGAVVCAVGVLSACSGSKKPTSSVVSASSSASAPSVVAAVPSTPKPKPKAAAVNPLTGIGLASNLPVIAVKIDDTAPGRPQMAIDKADIVYIETAEGGLSRLVGIFGTQKPVVGYVRSTRPSDPELLLQYGKITLAASGGGGDSLPLLDSSGLTAWINDRSAGYYNRAQRSESDYINLTLDLAQVARSVTSAKPKSIGFTWSRTLGAIRPTGRGINMQTTVGSTPVDFRWDPTLKKYVRYIDGVRQVAADGSPVATSNVIVQGCVVTPHPGDVDVNGNPAQFTNTIGKGAVTIFRNGVAIRGTWTRANVNSGTIFRNAAGKVIPLAPGGAWIALTAAGTPVVGT